MEGGCPTDLLSEMELPGIKRSVEGTLFDEILSDVRQQYQDEMGKHFSSNLFINPPQLETIHGEVKGTLFKGLEERTVNLTQLEKDNLITAANNWSQIFKNRNYMNFSSGEMGEAPAIGIHLGRRHSSVAVYFKGKVHIVPNPDQGGILKTPSYVSRNPDVSVMDLMEIVSLDITDPEHQSKMKQMSWAVVEEDGIPKLKVGNEGEAFYPEKLLGEFLAKLRAMAEKFLKLEPGAVKRGIITVPSNFNERQRKLVTDAAGKFGGLIVPKVDTFLIEPEAAAFAYSLINGNVAGHSRKILTYNLGRRSLEVTVLALGSRSNKILVSKWDTQVGGDYFDEEMAKYCSACFRNESGVDLIAGLDSTRKTDRDESERMLKRLKSHCEKAKINLGSCSSTRISIDAIINGLDLYVGMTRGKFEELNRDNFDKSIRLVEEALKDAELTAEEIQDVILVGGSSRIPKLHEMLASFFGGKSLNVSIPSEFVIAHGAALQVALLSGKQSFNKLNKLKRLEEMQNLATASITKLKCMMRSTVEEWLKDHLSLDNVAEIRSIYDTLLKEVLADGHKQVHIRQQLEFYWIVDRECRSSSLAYLKALEDRIQQFNLTIRKQFQLLSYFTHQDLDKLGKEEKDKVSQDLLANGNFELGRLVVTGCDKLMKSFRDQNREIIYYEELISEKLAPDAVTFLNEEMSRFLKEGMTSYSPARFMAMQAELRDKLVDAFKEAFKLVGRPDICAGVQIELDILELDLDLSSEAYIKQNNSKFCMELLRTSKSKYVSKIEDVIARNPSGLEAEVLKKRHSKISWETQKWLETEIRKTNPNNDQLQGHIQEFQAFATSDLKYICDINDLHLRKRMLKEEQERNRFVGLMKNDSLDLQSDQEDDPMESASPPPENHVIGEIEPPGQIHNELPQFNELHILKQQLLQQCIEMKSQLDGGLVFKIKSRLARDMFYDKIQGAIAIAQNQNSPLPAVREQLESLEKWGSKYTK